MRRWFRLASLGFVFVLLLSWPGGPKAHAQGGEGIIPPGEFGSKADPPGDITAHYSTNRQDEPWVALNPSSPLNALNLAMGFNDWSGNSCTGSPDPTNTTPSDCRSTPGVSLSGFVRSRNGGSSYDRRGRLELAAAGAGAGAFAFGDPSVAFGRQNVVYYFTIGFPGTSPSDLTNADLFMAKSTDGGGTYPTAVNVSNNVRFDDKPSGAVDVNANSACVDNVYVGWTEFGKNGQRQPDKIMFGRSTDGGQTFHIKQLSPASKFRSGAAVKAGRDGTVYFAWLDRARMGAELTMAISNDCGEHFDRHIDVATVNPVDSPYPGASFRVNSFPALATDPSDGNTLYVAWADRTNGHTVIKVAKSTTKGLTWNEPVVAGNVTNYVFTGKPASAFFPALDVDTHGNVNLAFLALQDKPTGTAPGKDVAHYAMFVRQSKNSPPGTAGSTWSDPLFGGGSGFGKCCSGDDPDASSTEDLLSQFLGDYISAVSVPLPSGSRRELLVAWTDTSLALTCAAVDRFRAGTGPKPNVIGQCPVIFGNTDIQLTRAFTYSP